MYVPLSCEDHVSSHDQSANPKFENAWRQQRMPLVSFPGISHLQFWLLTVNKFFIICCNCSKTKGREDMRMRLEHCFYLVPHLIVTDCVKTSSVVLIGQLFLCVNDPCTDDLLCSVLLRRVASTWRDSVCTGRAADMIMWSQRRVAAQRRRKSKSKFDSKTIHFLSYPNSYFQLVY